MNWQRIKTQIEGLGLSSAQLTNALDFISAAQGVRTPQGVTVKSHDAGVSLHWATGELVVYDDRYETYSFLNGETVIHHWPRIPGEAIDPTMLVELLAN